MTQPTPSNPLDKYVYPTSENFTPSMKRQYIGQIGKGTPLDVVKIKSIPIIKLKAFDKVIDVVEDRRNKRTMLINRKAEALETSLNDTLEQNEIEMRYRRQKEQMNRLGNVFSQGILSNLYKNVEATALADFQRDYFDKDPDIANFDEESKQVLETAENVVRLQKQNEELEAKLLRLEQDIQNQLKERAMKAETGDDVEQITQEVAEYNKIPKADPITPRPQTLEDDEMLRAEEDALSDSVDSLQDRIDTIERFVEEKKETPKRVRLTAEEKQERRDVLTFNINQTIATIDQKINEEGIDVPKRIRTSMRRFREGFYNESPEITLRNVDEKLRNFLATVSE